MFVYCQFGNPSETLFGDISKTDGALAFIASSDGKNVLQLIGLADANFANITDEQRKSISGFCYYVFGCPVSWRSKLQTITAGSTLKTLKTSPPVISVVFRTKFYENN